MTASTSEFKVKTPLGPSGRAMAQPMDPSLVEAFQLHVTMERNASAAYLAMAIWLGERELRGFSQFFKNESTSEQDHACKFADYLISRGQKVLLQDIPSPRQDWSSVEEIISASFQMEAEVTTSLHNLYNLAERSSDMRTTVFLDPTIDVQVSAEDEFAHLLGRVRFADNQPSAMLILDSELTNGQHTRFKLA
ncbi:ferritin [Prochlorococcus sp. MIT 1300]|uniref:ferritin n=1 Tax=Prochlorococcus sp. MIT 1300 TaxID=3096218 RepID=UPI002A748CCF|nr:ferritin [Prochlorococcus sp. MIT 1300]